MIMIKLIAAITSVLVSLGLAASFSGAQPPPHGSGPVPKVKKEKGDPKKKGRREPGADLSKAYDLLRRLRADDSSTGRPDERLREWTERAAGFYRQGLKAMNASDMRVAAEYGTAAHDLARAVDHARNAVRFDRPDPDLPPPSDDFGLEDARERSRRDLYRAYERISSLGQWQAAPNAEFYFKAARDLYSAARRDLEAGRDERAGELARAAEAMTHVPEHLAQAGEDRGRVGYRPVPPPEGPDGPGPKAKRPEPKGKRPEPKDDDFEPLDRPGAGLPPALPPGV
jgi:hypothetical protein